MSVRARGCKASEESYAETRAQSGYGALIRTGHFVAFAIFADGFRQTTFAEGAGEGRNGDEKISAGGRRGGVEGDGKQKRQQVEEGGKKEKKKKKMRMQ
ncbi:unnamed protein product [Sphagnum balticum]